jgi:hypothetical protein
MSQAYYQSTIQEFLNSNDNEVIGKLNLGGVSFVSQYTMATVSWESSIQILKSSLNALIEMNPNAANWHIFLEYEIPRLSSRIDAVIIADDLIFVIEFKYDRKVFELADIRQVEEYALDLSDFHLQSRNKSIIPILLAPLAKTIEKEEFLTGENNVKACLKSNTENFPTIINTAYFKYHNELVPKIDSLEWENSEYQPTPTIIQSAKNLFAGQKVETISKSGADDVDLKRTTKYLIDKINDARLRKKKIVCFVTGVPGAGKTLVGLNVVHEKETFGGHDVDTAYFSGNGPLIKVLKEALARDHFSRHTYLYKIGEIKERPTKSESERQVKSKVQNLHSFIKEGIRNQNPPFERIVVFDEAQRCWDAKHFFNQSKRNQNRETNPFKLQEKSEAELLFEFMSRHEGYSVIIALVGGGQEINTGEAGIAEWGKAIQEKYSDWEVHISPQLLTGDSVTAGKTLFESIPSNVIIHKNEELHLSVNRRSFKASNLNLWVNAVIDNNIEEASRLAKGISPNYPLLITRNIDTAKEWLKSKMLGNKRIGLLASSGGLRLRPYGINVKEQIDEAYWFLNDEKDVRSSYYLEITATEFAVQGLELDWTGVCWDADLRRNIGEWDFKSFSGTKWQRMESESDRQYLLNKYRVLLTRAREGIIVFVPEGDIADATRSPEFYDPIFEYLKSCGLIEI